MTWTQLHKLHGNLTTIVRTYCQEFSLFSLFKFLLFNQHIIYLHQFVVVSILSEVLIKHVLSLSYLLNFHQSVFFHRKLFAVYAFALSIPHLQGKENRKGDQAFVCKGGNTTFHSRNDGKAVLFPLVFDVREFFFSFIFFLIVFK